MHLEKLEKKQIAGFVVKRNQTTEQQKKLFDILLQFAQEHLAACNRNPTAYLFLGAY